MLSNKILNRNSFSAKFIMKIMYVIASYRRRSFLCISVENSEVLRRNWNFIVNHARLSLKCAVIHNIWNLYQNFGMFTKQL